MDKNEFTMKLEEIDALAERGDFEGAAAAADTVDWRRVKNLRTLCTVAEIYEACKRYEDSLAILQIAYKRSGNSKSVVYRLAEMNIRVGNFDDAERCIREYKQLSPHDMSRYILLYKLARAKKVPLDDQIAILRTYKDREYTERWAYELARLYHQNGQDERCVAECDDMILWFSQGKYVLRAMDLKRQIQPLTEEQEALYNKEKERLRMEAEVAENARLAKERQAEEEAKARELREQEEAEAKARALEEKRRREEALREAEELNRVEPGSTIAAIDKLDAVADQALAEASPLANAPNVAMPARQIFPDEPPTEEQEMLASSIREVFADVRGSANAEEAEDTALDELFAETNSTFAEELSKGNYRRLADEPTAEEEAAWDAKETPRTDELAPGETLAEAVAAALAVGAAAAGEQAAVGTGRDLEGLEMALESFDEGTDGVPDRGKAVLEASADAAEAAETAPDGSEGDIYVREGAPEDRALETEEIAVEMPESILGEAEDLPEKAAEDIEAASADAEIAGTAEMPTKEDLAEETMQAAVEAAMNDLSEEGPAETSDMAGKDLIPAAGAVDTAGEAFGTGSVDTAGETLRSEAGAAAASEENEAAEEAGEPVEEAGMEEDAGKKAALGAAALGAAGAVAVGAAAVGVAGLAKGLGAAAAGATGEVVKAMAGKTAKEELFFEPVDGMDASDEALGIDHMFFEPVPETEAAGAGAGVLLMAAAAEKAAEAGSGMLPETDSEETRETGVKTAGEVLPEDEGEVLPETAGDALPEAEGKALPETEGEILPEAEGEALPEIDAEAENGALSEAAAEAETAEPEEAAREIGKTRPHGAEAGRTAAAEDELSWMSWGAVGAGETAEDGFDFSTWEAVDFLGGSVKETAKETIEDAEMLSENAEEIPYVKDAAVSGTLPEEEIMAAEIKEMSADGPEAAETAEVPEAAETLADGLAVAAEEPAAASMSEDVTAEAKLSDEDTEAVRALIEDTADEEAAIRALLGDTEKNVAEEESSEGFSDNAAGPDSEPAADLAEEAPAETKSGKGIGIAVAAGVVAGGAALVGAAVSGAAHVAGAAVSGTAHAAGAAAAGLAGAVGAAAADTAVAEAAADLAETAGAEFAADTAEAAGLAGIAGVGLAAGYADTMPAGGETDAAVEEELPFTFFGSDGKSVKDMERPKADSASETRMDGIEETDSTPESEDALRYGADMTVKAGADGSTAENVAEETDAAEEAAAESADTKDTSPVGAAAIAAGGIAAAGIAAGGIAAAGIAAAFAGSAAQAGAEAAGAYAEEAAGAYAEEAAGSETMENAGTDIAGGIAAAGIAAAFAGSAAQAGAEMPEVTKAEAAAPESAAQSEIDILAQNGFEFVEFTAAEPAGAPAGDTSDGKTKTKDDKTFVDEILGADKRPVEPRDLDETETELLSYFSRIPGIPEQVTMAMADVYNHSGERTSNRGNILIMGRPGSGKSRLAEGMILAMGRDLGIQAVKSARLTAQEMNQKNAATVIGKMAGGFLVIEAAGSLRDDVVENMSEAMEFRTDGLVIILEDERKELRKMLARHPSFSEKFTSEVAVPVFTNDELVMFAKTYAKERGYKLDEMAVLALYTEIGENQRDEEPVTVGMVRMMVDRAINRTASHRFGRRRIVDTDGRIILREKDFDY